MVPAPAAATATVYRDQVGSPMTPSDNLRHDRAELVLPAERAVESNDHLLTAAGTNASPGRDERRSGY